MPGARRLTETERRSIAAERARGVPARVLAERYGVSRMSIYNAVSRSKAQQETRQRPSRMVGVRLSARDLAGFDAAIARRGIARRQDAMRRLMRAADRLLQPDEAMTARLRAMNVELAEVGGKVNQVARQLNEAKLRGARPPYTGASHDTIRDLAVLVTDMADQLREMFSARRLALGLEVAEALVGPGTGGLDHVNRARAAEG